MSENQICGADGSNSVATSCICLNENSWDNSETKLVTPRWGHSAWSMDDGTLLMGGGESKRDWTSTEFVKSPKDTKRITKKMNYVLTYEAKYACAIQLGDSIVLTGMTDPRTKKGWKRIRTRPCFR